MKFNSQKTSLIKIKKPGHYLIDDYVVYFNDNAPMFGAIEIKFNDSFRWGLVHLVSEHLIASKFNSIKEVESYFNFLMKEIDVNAIILYHPDIKFIKDEIGIEIELAYKKYLASYKGK